MLQPAMGGLIIGLMLLVTPQVMGVGYQYVDQALDGALALRVLVMLCVAKLVATIVSYASGNAGGIFAPSLFLGAMAGGAVGMLMNSYAPFPTGSPGAYALVGMGALFAGIIRAPMTSVFMIFELTQDYEILVPLMVANLLAYVISARFQSKPLYEALLEQDQIHLPGHESRTSSGAYRAIHLMEKPALIIAPEATAEHAAALIGASEADCFVVGDGDAFAGLVLRKSILASVASGDGDVAIRGMLIADPEHVHADHSLDLTMERFRRSPGILPVLSRQGTNRLDGVITLDSMLRFFQRHPEE